jgi:transposase
LETLGHEVIVADPNVTAMYGHRSRRIKRDRRDVAALAEACQRGVYRVAHRRSAPRRTVQAQLNIRRELTEARTRAIALTRAIVRGGGFRIRSGSTGTFLTRVAALDLPPSMTATLSPVRRVIELLNTELTRADETFATHVVEDPVVRRLTTLPGIGPITASAYVAALDDAARFGRAAQVASYLGLVPREYSSGEQHRRGHVLRSAHPYVQALLVQAAWRIVRVKDPRTAALSARGPTRLRDGVERRLPWSPWRDAWRGCSLRCGATRSRLTPHGFGRRRGRRSPRVMTV